MMAGTSIKPYLRMLEQLLRAAEGAGQVVVAMPGQISAFNPSPELRKLLRKETEQSVELHGCLLDLYNFLKHVDETEQGKKVAG